MEVLSASTATTLGERRGRRRWLLLPLPRLPRLPLPGTAPRVTRPRKATFASATAATVAIVDCCVAPAGGGTLAVAAAVQTPPAAPVGGVTPAATVAVATKVALKPASDVVAGALARAASQSTIHPLDTLKVRLQAASGGGPGAPTLSKFGRLVPPAGAGGAAAVAPAGGAAAAAALELRAVGAGVRSLYKGVVGAASGAGIAIGAYFALYGAACNVLTTHTTLAPGGVAFVAGAAAAAGSSVVKVPLAVCIRSVQAGVYPNVFAAARAITAAAGPAGLFTGYCPTLLEDVPDMAIKFAAYETMRSLHRSLAGGRAASPGEDFAMGAIAGAAAAAATTPLDVVKTRMMCSAASRPSMAAAAGGVLAQSGPRGFFAGVGTRALSNGINSAVFFCFFEAIRGAFRERSAAAAAAAAAGAPPRALPLLAAADGASAEGDDAYAREQLRQPAAVVRARPAGLLASATPLQLDAGPRPSLR